MGSSKTHNQHQKMRTKEEMARESAFSEKAKIDSKVTREENKQAVKANNENMSQFVHDHKKEIHNGKKDAMKEAKDIKKGRAEQEESKQVWGGHVFETRIEGSGPKCQAEQDLDHIAKVAQNLNTKANQMTVLVDEGSDRARRLNSDVVRANERTAALNKQADRYCGRK